ncbi:hypothetical protein PPS11_02413 [Pseudomonas putida S11]|nr:hypothetical protein PPS11_02413 [Pseudomonas putida S11]
MPSSFFQHEQVVGVATLGFAAEALLRPANAMPQALFVGRQRGQPGGTGAACQFDQRRQIAAAYRTNDHAISLFAAAAAGAKLF